MRKTIYLITIISLALLFSACDSKPEVEVVVPQNNSSMSSTTPAFIPIPEIVVPDEPIYEEVFTSSEITDEIFNRINGLSFKEGCDINLEDLRYLQVSYIGFDKEPHTGELICNKAIADDLLDIFQTLYEHGYEIESIALVDDFNADDELSMEANNTSCFNYRTIKNSSKLSVHSYGRAIDINPFYNPYIKKADGSMKIEPSTAIDYINRDEEFPHKIDTDDLAYKLFIDHGFSWGGSWKTYKDYQHFEKLN